MSDLKEDGTTHYRSGIYDVVSVAAKHRVRKASNVIVKEEYSDIRDVLLALNANVEENTKAIRALHAHLNAGGDRSTRRRKDRVTVYLRVAFLRIIDVDTKEGTYTGDVFIQASWLEPALQSASQEELDDMDYDQVWKPNIMVTNLAGTPEHMQRWYGGGRQHEGQKIPLLYLRIALRAKFKENLELSSFPIDAQALNVTVGSERSEAEVNFEEDLATVNLETFQDQSEFRLHPHVEVERKKGNIHGADLYSRSPKLNFCCHVTRRPGFYFWNMFLVLFLITGLLFTCYIFAPDKADYRMKISLTLLLVAVAYKLVMIKEMPKLPFMSYMGGYMLACILFLVWQNIQNGIIMVVVSGSGLAFAMECDRYMFAVLCFLYLFFNIVYLSVIIIKYFMGQNLMNTKNDNYQNKMRVRDSEKGYGNPAYYQHDHSYTMPRNAVEPAIIREDRPRRKSKRTVEYQLDPEYIVKEPDYDEAIKNTVVKSQKNKEIKSRARDESDTVFIGASEA